MNSTKKNNLNEKFNGYYQIKGWAESPTDYTGGSYSGKYKYNRYILFGSQLKKDHDKIIANPIVSSKLRYNLNTVVLFDSIEQAEQFLMRFEKRSNNQQRSPIKWSIVKYNGDAGNEYYPVYLVDTKYGPCYSVKDFDKTDPDLGFLSDPKAREFELNKREKRKLALADLDLEENFHSIFKELKEIKD